MSSASEPIAGRDPADVALAAAEAAAAVLPAAVLPAAEVLTASGAQPGSEQVAALFASGVVADLAGGAAGPLGLLVAEDLVQAIAESPIEGLDLAAAVQPALDAAAQVLGGTSQVLDLGRTRRPQRVLHGAQVARAEVDQRQRVRHRPASPWSRGSRPPCAGRSPQPGAARARTP